MKKNNCIKVLAVVLYLSLTLINDASAQVHTFSPYSRKGVGLIADKNFGASAAMGNTGLALRLSNSVNFYNPASYTVQDTLSFVFDFGVNMTHSEYKTSESSEEAFDANLDHFAVAFPIKGKIWYSSIGLLPYSHVGYSIIGSQILQNADSTKVDEIYKGQGGLNKFYFGNGVNITPWLSAGLNISYIFGVIDYEFRSSFQRLVIDEVNDTSYYVIDPDKFNIHKDEDRNITGFRFTYGIQLHKRIQKYHYVVFGATYENKHTLYEDNNTTVANLAPVSSNTTNITYKDTLLRTTGKITMPSSLGFGLSYMYKLSFLATFDYRYTGWSKYKNLGWEEPDNATIRDTLYNSNQFNIGFEFVNNPISRNYLSRIHFRLGASYNSGNIKIDGNRIETYSLSGGLGLPFGASNTMFHLGYEYNVEGTTAYNLIQNNYGVVYFGATLYDLWFFKRKFD